jgi:hypothetical protein
MNAAMKAAKNAVMRRVSSAVLQSSLVIVIGACAIPATEVDVTTMPMRQALDLARAEGNPAPGLKSATPRLTPGTPPQGTQKPLLSTPEVRLAYLYEWVDPEGNRHFGEWVAIPIAGFDWIMTDGTRAPIDAAGRENAPPLDGR